MNKMAEACISCPRVRLCFVNDFESCPRIEMAAKGLGIPIRPKKVESYIDNVPFGVYMGLKHIMEKVGRG